MVSVDYVAIVDAFPKPDEKVRGRSLQVIVDGGHDYCCECRSIVFFPISFSQPLIIFSFFNLLQVFGGGNAANALTCASRLGLTPKLITKVSSTICQFNKTFGFYEWLLYSLPPPQVGDDSLGQKALAELQADGVDTSLVKVGYALHVLSDVTQCKVL